MQQLDSSQNFGVSSAFWNSKHFTAYDIQAAAQGIRKIPLLGAANTDFTEIKLFFFASQFLSESLGFCLLMPIQNFAGDWMQCS